MMETYPCTPLIGQELIGLGYDITTSCDGFGRTPAMVAARHDQGAALDLIRHSLAVVDFQRLVRGFLGRRKAIRIGANRGIEGGFIPTSNGADIHRNLRDDIGSAKSVPTAVTSVSDVTPEGTKQ